MLLKPDATSFQVESKESLVGLFKWRTDDTRIYTLRSPLRALYKKSYHPNGKAFLEEIAFNM